MMTTTFFWLGKRLALIALAVLDADAPISAPQGY